MQDPHILHRNTYEAAPGTGYGIWLMLLAINLISGIFSTARIIVNHMHVLDARTWMYFLPGTVISSGADQFRVR
jgi:hypothetical protein